jgi:hypothetical protein
MSEFIVALQGFKKFVVLCCISVDLCSVEGHNLYPSFFYEGREVCSGVTVFLSFNLEVAHPADNNPHYQH